MPTILTVGEKQGISHRIAHWFMGIDLDEFSASAWNKKMASNVPVYRWLSVDALENYGNIIRWAVVASLIQIFPITADDHADDQSAVF